MTNLFPPQNAFPPEEYGSGSRPTPLVDAPAWLKAEARIGTDQAAPAPAEQPSLVPGERVSLAPAERAFLESIPSYEEEAPPLPSLVPAAQLTTPSLARKVLSKLLFVAIAGSASAVLALAISRMLGHPILP